MSNLTGRIRATAVNVSRNATGSNVYELFLAKSPTFIEKVVFQSLGSNDATVARIFINEEYPITGGRFDTTGVHNFLLDEVTLPLTAASETAELASVEVTITTMVGKEQQLLITLGTAPASGYDIHLVTNTLELYQSSRVITT